MHPERLVDLVPVGRKVSGRMGQIMGERGKQYFMASRTTDGSSIPSSVRAAAMRPTL
jgi:hypothetical protein